MILPASWQQGLKIPPQAAPGPPTQQLKSSPPAHPAVPHAQPGCCSITTLPPAKPPGPVSKKLVLEKNIPELLGDIPKPLPKAELLGDIPWKLPAPLPALLVCVINDNPPAGADISARELRGPCHDPRPPGSHVEAPVA